MRNFVNHPTQAHHEILQEDLILLETVNLLCFHKRKKKAWFKSTGVYNKA
jgi:hypothetical protein